MEHKSLLFVMLVAILALGGGFWYYKNKMTMNSSNACMCTKNLTQLRLGMRKLWEDHIVYTRNFIISAIANLEDKDEVLKRLLQNQVDTGNAIKAYYGEDAGNALTKLLKEHIMLAGDVVTDAIKNDTQKLNQDNAQWQRNADEIAAFLSKANPNWSEKALRDALYKHLEMTTGEATSRLKKDWVADIGFYDKNHDHMLMVSDVLTDGIVKQFPDKFK